MRRLWIPLLVLAVVGAGAFAVSRLHGIFGSEQRPAYADTEINKGKSFNPKQMSYEVFGPPGSVADISYFDVDAEPRFISGVSLPWVLKFDVTKATAVGSILAQSSADSIGCRIIVDNEVKSEKTSNDVRAFTSCLLKAA